RPHADYAKSALPAERHGRRAAGRPCRSVLAATRVDVAVALAVAGTVNLALLLLGAGALAGDERSATVEGVHAALGDTLGGGVAVLFAVGLLFSGLASTVVGCYSGGVVMGGLLRVRVPVLVRRAVTAVPALVVLGLGTSPTTVLLVSQMVLSFGIPFAIVPLVLLTSRRSVMGADVNRRVTVVAAAVICAAVVAVNLALLAMALGPA
ncbi:Nramp family divalent metal transporter, partial [Blastococcus sp. SYSU D00820]